MSRARDFADLAGSADAGGLTGRNLIINGSKVIDQRNGGSSVSVTAGTVKDLADRWKADIAGGVNGVFSAQQQTSVVPTGFQYATKLTVTTAHTTAGTSHYYRYFYAGIEGYDTNQLELGTSNAKTVTISFYVRSSVTGTYCVGLQNETFNRAYSAEYSISSADTWERKEVTVALDQSGTWSSTNGIGLRLFWDLGSGSTWNMTADTWAATNTWKTSNQTAWIENSSATFYITGVQLEVGEQATPFEHRSFADELARCQRYCYVRGGEGVYELFMLATANGSATCTGVVQAPVKMRTRPTHSISSTAHIDLYDFDGSAHRTLSGSGTLVTSIASTSYIYIDWTTSGVTSGANMMVRANNTTDARFTLDAEL